METTFAALMALEASLDAEQRRVGEGRTENELALFDLLLKERITKADRERLKQASRDLLAALRDIFRPMRDWVQNASTQPEVKLFILDSHGDRCRGRRSPTRKPRRLPAVRTTSCGSEAPLYGKCGLRGALIRVSRLGAEVKASRKVLAA